MSRKRQQHDIETISRTRSIVYIVVGILLCIPLFLHTQYAGVVVLMAMIGGPLAFMGMIGRRKSYPSVSTAEADLARIRFVEEMKLRGKQ
jgi:hypothetical protein